MTTAVSHQQSAIGHWCLGFGSAPPASHQRHGVSLLEVLVSIFVLTAGLLGIAAMLPLASLDIIEATKCENAEIVGIRSMGEVTIRELYNPRLWMRYNGEEIVQAERDVRSAASSSRRPTMVLEDYNSIAIIDPVLIAQYPGASGDPDVGGSGQFPLHVATTDLIGRRYSLRPYSEYSSRMNLSMAERVFLSHDDLDFVEPADENDRPRINMACKATDASSSDVETALPWPYRGWEGDSNYTNPEAMVPLANNHYSWLAVVVPQFVVWQRDFVDDDGDNRIYLDTRSPSYQVSVVVYYRRQYEEPGSPLEPATPTERRVTVQFQGDGRNGGEVRLRCASGDPSSYLELRTNDIIMVAQERTIHAGPPVVKQPVANFYRVVGLDDIDESPTANPDQAERYATLDGPDWVIDGDAYAVIIPGIIGVRTAKFNVQ